MVERDVGHVRSRVRVPPVPHAHIGSIGSASGHSGQVGSGRVGSGHFPLVLIPNLQHASGQSNSYGHLTRKAGRPKPSNVFPDQRQEPSLLYPSQTCQDWAACCACDRPDFWGLSCASKGRDGHGPAVRRERSCASSLDMPARPPENCTFRKVGLRR